MAGWPFFLVSFVVQLTWLIQGESKNSGRHTKIHVSPHGFALVEMTASVKS
jgi:hypothetical protein